MWIEFSHPLSDVSMIHYDCQVTGMIFCKYEQESSEVYHFFARHNNFELYDLEHISKEKMCYDIFPSSFGCHSFTHISSNT